MHPTWQTWLVQQRPLLEAIEQKVLAEAQVTPDLNQVMRAFDMDPANIKVVILGQDPYPTSGDAIGLAFAMSPASKMPRSLVNIVKELRDDLGAHGAETSDPKCAALCETSHEVLAGLEKAFDHYLAKSEKAWQ